MPYSYTRIIVEIMKDTLKNNFTYFICVFIVFLFFFVSNSYAVAPPQAHAGPFGWTQGNGDPNSICADRRFDSNCNYKVFGATDTGNTCCQNLSSDYQCVGEYYCPPEMEGGGTAQGGGNFYCISKTVPTCPVNNTPVYTTLPHPPPLLPGYAVPNTCSYIDVNIMTSCLALTPTPTPTTVPPCVTDYNGFCRLDSDSSFQCHNPDYSARLVNQPDCPQDKNYDYLCCVRTPTPTVTPPCLLSAHQEQCNDQGTGWNTLPDVCVAPSVCSI